MPMFLEPSDLVALRQILPDTWESFLKVMLAEAKSGGSIQSIMEHVESGSATREIQQYARAYNVIHPQAKSAVDMFKAHKMCLQNPVRVRKLLDLCLSASRIELTKVEKGAQCVFNSRITNADVQCRNVVFVKSGGEREFAVMYEKYSEFFQMLWCVTKMPSVALKLAKDWVSTHVSWNYEQFKASEDVKHLLKSYNTALTWLRLWWDHFDGVIIC